MKTNKTESLTRYMTEAAKDITHPGTPDCRNRHPGTGWKWSPSQTATKAAPGWAIANCWHGSAPTPGTQMIAELADKAAEWLRVWDIIPRDGKIHEFNGVNWKYVDGDLTITEGIK